MCCILRADYAVHHVQDGDPPTGSAPGRKGAKGASAPATKGRGKKPAQDAKGGPAVTAAAAPPERAGAAPAAAAGGEGGAAIDGVTAAVPPPDDEGVVAAASPDNKGTSKRGRPRKAADGGAEAGRSPPAASPAPRGPDGTAQAPRRKPQPAKPAAAAAVIAPTSDQGPEAISECPYL